MAADRIQGGTGGDLDSTAALVTSLEMQRRILAMTKTDKTNTLLKKSIYLIFLFLIFRCLR